MLPVVETPPMPVAAAPVVALRIAAWQALPAVLASPAVAASPPASPRVKALHHRVLWHRRLRHLNLNKHHLPEKYKNKV